MGNASSQSHNEELLKTLEKGDMVKIDRGPYSHWVIYIGNERIIHLTGDLDASSKTNDSIGPVFSISGVRFNKAWVREDDLIEVAGNDKAYKKNKDKKATPLDKQTIVQRARERLGEIGYNILWHNCECFASWCRYGIGWSEQRIVFEKYKRKEKDGVPPGNDNE